MSHAAPRFRILTDACRRWLWRFVRRVRFGRITEHCTDTIAGHACEIEYRDRRGRIVGFWAYGSWDPSYPYKGET